MAGFLKGNKVAARRRRQQRRRPERSRPSRTRPTPQSGFANGEGRARSPDPTRAWGRRSPLPRTNRTGSAEPANTPGVTRHEREWGDEENDPGSRSSRGRRTRRRGSGARRARPRQRHGFQPQRGAADLGGSGRRQHRRLRVREPGQAGHGHDPRELHPARGAGGRPELQRLRRRRPLRAEGRQHRRRRRGHQLPVPLPHRDPEPEHVPLQHRPDRHALGHGLEPAAVLQRHPRRQARRRHHRRRLAHDARPERPDPARHDRPALDAELRLADGRGDPDAPGRRQGLRRPDRRPVLRRPRLGLRPRRPAAVQPGPRDPAAGGAGRGRRRRVQHAHDRAAGADRAADQGQGRADGAERPRRRARDLRDREPPARAGARQGRPAAQDRRLRAGLAARRTRS